MNELDYENNYFSFGARNYDSETGRFLSVDPLFEAFPSQKPYHYAYNIPMQFKDPSGLAPEKEKKEKVMAMEDVLSTYYQISNLLRMVTEDFLYRQQLFAEDIDRRVLAYDIRDAIENEDWGKLFMYTGGSASVRKNPDGGVTVTITQINGIPFSVTTTDIINNWGELSERAKSLAIQAIVKTMLFSEVGRERLSQIQASGFSFKLDVTRTGSELAKGYPNSCYPLNEGTEWIPGYFNPTATDGPTMYIASELLDVKEYGRYLMMNEKGETDYLGLDFFMTFTHETQHVWQLFVTGNFPSASWLLNDDWDSFCERRGMFANIRDISAWQTTAQIMIDVGFEYYLYRDFLKNWKPKRR